MGRVQDFITLKTISSKISLVCVIDCIVLVFFIFLIIDWSMRKVQTQVIEDQLDTDIAYLECKLGDCTPAPWEVRDNFLYRGDVRLGDGTEANANTAPFLEVHDSTDSFCYVGLKTTDEGLGINAVNGNQQGHYMRVAGNTKDANGNSIAGTYLDKDIADALDNTGEYLGESNVQGKRMLCYYRTVTNEKGEVIGFISVGRHISDINEQARKTGQFILLLLIAIAILAGIGIIIVSRRCTNNITAINVYLNRISEGELPEDKLILKSQDETAAVANCINEMVDSLRNSRRIGVELSLASDIQAHMLPCIFPPFPDSTEFDVFASMTPAKEVGGDFYDFFMLDEKRIAVVIADVSGKGIPSALVMVIAKTLIKNHMMYGLEPAEAFTTVNKMLCESDENSMFVTAWMGVLNTETGILTYVNAGHNPPLIKTGDEKFEYLHSTPGFVLAGMEGIRYKQNSLQMKSGDRLFLYTDGVTEAGNAKGEFYGEKHLQDFLNAHISDQPANILKAVKKDIDDFSENVEQFDDITMLMLDFHKPYENKDMTERIFPAEDSALEQATAFLEEELNKLDCSPKAMMQLSVALEEIFVNIAHYAYPGLKGIVRIAIYHKDDKVRIRFTDSGIPFNPLEKDDPDINTSAEDRDIGGLGIFLAKKTVDDVSYEYQNGQNILNIVKTIS